MADPHAVATGGHPDMDYLEHERTYRFFTGLVKYGIVGLVVLMILMAFFLV